MFMGDEWADSVDGYIGYLKPTKEEEKEENPKPVGARRTRSVKRFSTKRRKTLKWKR